MLVDRREIVIGFDDDLRKDPVVGRDDIDLAHQTIEHIGRFANG